MLSMQLGWILIFEYFMRMDTHLWVLHEDGYSPVSTLGGWILTFEYFRRMDTHL